MSRPKHDPFERLRPPPGGQRRLRERLVVETRRQRERTAMFGLVSAMTIAVAAVVVWITLGESSSRRAAAPAQPAASLFETNPQAHPALAGLTARAMPVEPVSVRGDNRHRYAVHRVHQGSDRVVFYMVSSQTTAPARTRADAP